MLDHRVHILNRDMHAQHPILSHRAIGATDHDIIVGNIDHANFTFGQFADHAKLCVLLRSQVKRDKRTVASSYHCVVRL